MHLVQQVIKTGVDVDVDASACADVDDDVTLDAKRGCLFVVIQALSLCFLQVLFVKGFDCLSMLLSKNCLNADCLLPALISADSNRFYQETYYPVRVAINLFDQLK